MKKPTNKEMKETLKNIALYPFPVFEIERDGKKEQMVPLANVDYLRTMAKEVLGME